MARRRLLLATLVAAAGTTAASVFVLTRAGEHESVTRETQPSVTISAPVTTPRWLLRLVSQKARMITKSAPTTGVIERRGQEFEVRLRGDFTWLDCGPCTKPGPLSVMIRHSIVFTVDLELRRVTMATGTPSLMR